MKKIIIMGILAMCLGVAACSSSKAEKNSDNFVSSIALSNKAITASKKYVSKTLTVDNFNAITNRGSYTVEYKYGDKPRVVLYMPDNILPYITVMVNNGQLFIRSKGNVSIRWGNNCKAKITVYAPSVRDFSLQGSGEFIIKEDLSGEDSYKFQVLGSGELTACSVKASDRITTILTGSGDLNIQSLEAVGSNGRVRLALTGSGDLNTNCVKSNSVSAELTGSGDINVAGINALKTNGSINGSGDMTLRGVTNAATLAVTGSGDLSAGNLKAEDVMASTTGSGDLTCYATGRTNFTSSRSSSIRNVAPSK